MQLAKRVLLIAAYALLLMGIPSLSFASDQRNGCLTAAAHPANLLFPNQNLDPQALLDRIEADEVNRCVKGEFIDPETGMSQMPPSYDESCAKDFACNLLNSVIDIGTAGQYSIWGNVIHNVKQHVNPAAKPPARQTCLNPVGMNCTTALATGLVKSLLADGEAIKAMVTGTANWAWNKIVDWTHPLPQPNGRSFSETLMTKSKSAVSSLSNAAHSISHLDVEKFSISNLKDKAKQKLKSGGKKLISTGEIIFKTGENIFQEITQYAKKNFGCQQWKGTKCVAPITSISCADCKTVANITCGLIGSFVGQGLGFKYFFKMVGAVAKPTGRVLRDFVAQNPKLDAQFKKVAATYTKGTNAVRHAKKKVVLTFSSKAREEQKAIEALAAAAKERQGATLAAHTNESGVALKTNGRYRIKITDPGDGGKVTEKLYTDKQYLAAYLKKAETPEEAVEAVHAYLRSKGMTQKIDVATELHVLGLAPHERLNARWFRLRDALAKRFVPLWEDAGAISTEELISLAKKQGGAFPTYSLPYLKNERAIAALTEEAKAIVIARRNSDQWLVALKSLAEASPTNHEFVRQHISEYLKKGMVYFGKNDGEDILFKVMRDSDFFNSTTLVRGFIEDAGKGMKTGQFVTKALASCDRRAADCEALIVHLLDNPELIAGNSYGAPITAIKKALSGFRELNSVEERGLSELLGSDPIRKVLAQKDIHRIKAEGVKLLASGKSQEANFGMIIRHLINTDTHGAAKKALELVHETTGGRELKYFEEFLHNVVHIGSPKIRDETILLLDRELTRLAANESTKKRLILWTLQDLRSDQGIRATNTALKMYRKGRHVIEKGGGLGAAPSKSSNAEATQHN